MFPDALEKLFAVKLHVTRFGIVNRSCFQVREMYGYVIPQLEFFLCFFRHLKYSHKNFPCDSVHHNQFGDAYKHAKIRPLFFLI